MYAIIHSYNNYNYYYKRDTSNTHSSENGSGICSISMRISRMYYSLSTPAPWGSPPPRSPRHVSSGQVGQGGSAGCAGGSGGVKGRGVGGWSSSYSDPSLVKKPLRSSAAIYMYVIESMINFLPISYTYALLKYHFILISLH